MQSFPARRDPGPNRRQFLIRAAGLGSASLLLQAAADGGNASTAYADGRPTANYRMNAHDQGVVLRHGAGPDQCDTYGARDVSVSQHAGSYYLLYDGAGPAGWNCCLAVSEDLTHWQRHGQILEHGSRGAPDACYTGYGPVCFAGGKWHLFYVGAGSMTLQPERVPAAPYRTLKAEALTPNGPWRKRYDLVPFDPTPGTYFADTASPGPIVKAGDGYRMFFSAARIDARGFHRTLACARTRDLDQKWSIDPKPLLPATEQIENASLYLEPTNRTWFLFTNHVGLKGRAEFTDAVWVYWSKDLDHWNPANKAVVLDGTNCCWSMECIGLPSVVPIGNRLALLYDAPGGSRRNHLGRDIGLAWLELPLRPPV